MKSRILSFFLICLSSASPGIAGSASIGSIVEDVVDRHMREKRIPGMSVAIVHDGRLIFSRDFC